MNNINFNPFPTLTTERLELKPFSLNDKYEVFTLRSDKQIIKYIDIPIAKTVEDAEAFIHKIIKGIEENEFINWGMYYTGTTKLLGTICLWNFTDDKFSAEVGYALLNEHQGKGLMQEALVTVLDYGFNKINLTDIDADFHKDNEASLKLLLRNNFVPKGTNEDYLIYTIKNNQGK